jgi:DNA gyrase inhibitor GyrI
MSELQVEIVRLAPMQVVSFYGFGREPEFQAAARMLAWAEPRGLYDEGTAHRVFGFNNPSPTAGSPNYGYEFWLEMKDGEAGTAIPEVHGGDVELKSFDGGLYAVARCRGVAAVPDTWRQLVTWLEDSRYTMSHSQCLEQHTGRIDGDIEALEFALYQAIVE